MSATRCYCTSPLRPDGTCRYGCPAAANPRHLRAQKAKRRKTTFDSNRTVGTMLRHTEVQDAAARVSPEEARNRERFTRRITRAKARV